MPHDALTIDREARRVNLAHVFTSPEFADADGYERAVAFLRNRGLTRAA